MNAIAIVLLSMLVTLGSTTLVSAQGGHQMMMKPRVPADKMAEARALTNPLPDSPEVVQQGKSIYEGKGTCFNCHGVQGFGNGPAAANLDPPPRNFRSHGFWRHRTEGELFWVVKNGIEGTAMLPFGTMLSDEEIWAVLEYERTFAGGPGHGKRGRDMAQAEGPQGGMAAPGRRRGMGMPGMGRRGMGMMEGRGEMPGAPCCGEGERMRGMGCPEECDKVALAGSVKVGMAEAIKAALDHTPGKVIEAELEQEEGRPVWEVEVVTEDNQVVELHVDGTSGEVHVSEDKPAGKPRQRERMREHEGHGRGGPGCCEMNE